MNNYDCTKTISSSITEWVEGILDNPESLIDLPLANDKASPYGVSISAKFLHETLCLSTDEAYRRRNLTLPLVKKMAMEGIVVIDAKPIENVIRHRILGWYSRLSFDAKSQLPKRKDNIQFASMESEQRKWAKYATQYDLIGKTFDEIHADLHKLGLIGPNYKTVTQRKQPVKNSEKTIKDLVDSLAVDIDVLWDLPITKDKVAPWGFNVSYSYIQQETGLSPSTVYKFRSLAYPLIKKMFELGIVVPLDESKEVSALDYRRKLLNWYRKLSLKEKEALPIFGNQIVLKRLPRNQISLTKQTVNRYEAVRKAWSEIHCDLQNLGVISSNYQTVDERGIERKNRQDKNQETKKSRFNRLSSIDLKVASDFLNPTESEPFVQVEQIFATTSNTIGSKSGKLNYQNACYLFIEFLVNLYGDAPFFIASTFDEHMLSRYRKSLEKDIIEGKISSHHANTTLSALRVTLRRLSQIRDFEYIFFDINGFDVNRTTDANRPFSKKERAQISDAINAELHESRLLVHPYKKSGIGENPLGTDGGRIRGKSTLDNARWLFENCMGCKPVHFSTAKTTAEKAFLSIILDSDSGLSDVYKAWGVVPLVTSSALIPYVLRLAQVTGMNAEPILSLEIDDLVDSHQATSRPCLRYWKERSDGHKEYHLDLFKADLTWLTSTQAKAIKEIFDEVLLLTGRFRQDIEDESLKSMLFVYQSDGVKTHGKIMSLLGNNKAIGAGFSQIVEKYNLKNDNGEPLTLNISRFRPTFVSEMVAVGVSLREIQLMLGHSSIQTTIGYLDSLDFNSISRMKLNDKLKEIHESTLEDKPDKAPQEVDSEQSIEVIFQTPMAGCKNIFDPPEFVKNLPSYTPGSPCAQYNKCLACDNVIITAKNLPEIFAMQRDYMLLTGHSRVMDTPYGHVIRDNMELIKGIVDPELSDFSSEELETGLRLSEYVETTILVDGVI